ncbi:MAG: zinc-binding dehydrogenase [Candidatus Andeanibacterium colombiense]|uniref:Zinc-binding dehydrogenase n=1 Tax=Candidatus Andeanibacterium colombiense TaxID=3121345 RepID=A0AAJ5X8A4_9SPHN|nr:MAG: zinc-binding dehydrogenase [Sphingomonadaceae bacterium]
MSVMGRQVVSTLSSDGVLTVEIVPEEIPSPSAAEVLIELSASPINPSDLALLFGPADLANAEFSPGKVIAQMPEAAVRAMAGRVGQRMPVGNEGSGTVIAAGEDPAAQALVGKRIACAAGGTYATHRLADARLCMELPDGLPVEQGAASYVNPLTVLGFVETMRKEGFSGIVHTAAASNLGQMLVKLCAEEGIPLVNIVRKPEQAALLKDLGAEHVVDSSDPQFMAQLVAAIAATGARIGFDAIGGGPLASQILSAMEIVAAKNLTSYSRYGSFERKKVYIYGALDFGPTVLNRSFGLTWDVGGWLLTPFLAQLPPEDQLRLRQRVVKGLTTTFASRFKAQIGLEEMLTRDVALAYNAKATSEKYLVRPNLRISERSE